MAEVPIHHKHVLVILLIIVTTCNAYLDNLNKPCKYLDSINITDGIKDQETDSIMFDGINYTKKLYDIYDYEFVNESYRHQVASHIRGCTCELKPCVRMCCPREKYFNGTNCVANDNDTIYNLSVNVTSDGVHFSRENLLNYFNYVVGKPCHSMNPMEPALYYRYDTWALFENGSISLGDPQLEVLDKNDYCFNSVTLERVNDNFKISFEVSLWTCYKPPGITKDSWLPYGMFLSVPFLIATIIVYIILPELRNVHGKSLVCYLLGLVVGYTTLGWVKLNGSGYIEATKCRTLGYTIYYAYLSAFFWLSVISYDLWSNFRGIHNKINFADFKKFAFYSAYAWGSTTIMTILCYIMDAHSNLPTDYLPGIGIQTCFLSNNSKWSQFIYLYLPIILIMSCNLTFFILTSWKIHKVQKDMAKMVKKGDSVIHRKNLDKEKDNWSLFLRLFIVMGTTWIMEAISWIISPEGELFYLTDLVNAIQGVVIFFLFVMRAKVKELIVKRWNIWRGKLPPAMGGTASNTSKTNTKSNATNTVRNEPIEMGFTSTATD